VTGLMVLLLLAQPAPPKEAPGLVELAAGLGCWDNLDAECAASYLKQALERFDPTRDDKYLQHVTQARWALAQVYLAAEDLSAAEGQLSLLLALNPDFNLPAGEHPPKLIYVFEQARRKALAEKKTASRPPLPAKEPKLPAPVPTPAEPKSQPVEISRQPAYPAKWFFEARGRADVVFGDDARALWPSGGVELGLGRRMTPVLAGGFVAGWSRHSLRQVQSALQQFALGLFGDFYQRAGAIELVFRLQGAAAAMGTRDRYDNFAALLDLGLGLLWEITPSFELTTWIAPQAVILAGGVSFRLGLTLGLRLPW